MKNHILILLIFAISLLSIHTHAQNTQTNPGLTTDNSFGILELFDGMTLYNHRVYRVDAAPKEYISMDMAVPFTVKISDDRNTLIIKDVIHTLQLRKTKIPGELKARSNYYKVTATKLLEDGSLQIFYGHRNVRGPRGSYVEHYQLAGLGLKTVDYEISKGENSAFIVYYETADEHKKTSGTDVSYPRIISVGETALAGNSSFRFLAGEQTNIKITTVPAVGKGKTYVTLYDIDGEVIKEVAGRGTLTLSHVIPVNGFYYISTMVDKGDKLKITLDEE